MSQAPAHADAHRPVVVMRPSLRAVALCLVLLGGVLPGGRADTNVDPVNNEPCTNTVNGAAATAEKQADEFTYIEGCGANRHGFGVRLSS